MVCTSIHSSRGTLGLGQTPPTGICLSLFFYHYLKTSKILFHFSHFSTVPKTSIKVLFEALSATSFQKFIYFTTNHYMGKGWQTLEKLQRKTRPLIFSGSCPQFLWKWHPSFHILTLAGPILTWMFCPVPCLFTKKRWFSWHGWHPIVWTSPALLPWLLHCPFWVLLMTQVGFPLKTKSHNLTVLKML